MIQVYELCFSYSGQPDVIRNMSFEVNEAEIFGFLGPSGAGKTTLQKILGGILRNYRGSAKVLGIEVKERTCSFYESIGMVFESPNLYGKFNALENLEFFSSLYKRRCKDPMEYLERVGLGADARKRVASYSRGMKMRLAFVRAILHQPSLLFLDEPTGSLDPGLARVIKNMILEQKREGVTVILTTHNMHDAEELCDRVAFIVDGRISALDKPHALRARKKSVEVAYSFVENGQQKTASTLLSSLHMDKQFMKHLKNASLTAIHSREPTLEDVFMDLTGRCLT